MDKNKFITFCIVFLAGFLCANLIFYVFLYGFEIPFSDNLSLFSEYDKSAPHDIVKDDEIEVLSDRIIIHINNPSLSRYAATGSMVPVFDNGANGIRIKPNSVNDIEVGDIVSFRKENILIVHRVIEKGEDEKGDYFITKGDNTNITDGKIRFGDIEYITVGVIW